MISKTQDLESFTLFGSCIPVRGARRSVVCDLNRRRMRTITNSLFELLEHRRGITLEDLAFKPGGDSESLRQQIQWLVSEGFGWWTPKPEEFPQMDLSSDLSSHVTNAIFDVASGSNVNYESLMRELDDLGCESLQVRAKDEVSAALVERLVTAAESLRFRHLELILKESEQLDFAFARRLCLGRHVVWRVILHSANEERRERVEHLPAEVVATQEQFSLANCGRVEPGSFSVNTWHFAEARCANSCLNRKVSVDPDGEIRPCPSHSLSLGNVNAVRLGEVIDKPELLRLWSTTKDQVEVCKDCEFRYVCTDCRANTTGGRELSKPAWCTYNPYTAKWE